MTMYLHKYFSYANIAFLFYYFPSVVLQYSSLMYVLFDLIIPLWNKYLCENMFIAIVYNSTNTVFEAT